MREFNSDGERLYVDGVGVKRTLRGMLSAEPEWVVSRFNKLQAENERLEAALATLHEKEAWISKLELAWSEAVFIASQMVCVKNARITELESALKDFVSAFNPNEQQSYDHARALWERGRKLVQ